MIEKGTSDPEVEDRKEPETRESRKSTRPRRPLSRSSSMEGLPPKKSNMDYWANLHLLTETGQNIIDNKNDSLTAKCLYVILKMAVENADTDLLKTCISLGIPIDSSDFSGRTPLMMCIEQDSPELVEQIIELGASIKQSSAIAESPLHYGVEKNKLKATEALIKLGKKHHDLNLNWVGADGMAALHKAAKLHLREMIILLVKYGADVDVKGENGSTPLHMAASCTISS